MLTIPIPITDVLSMITNAHAMNTKLAELTSERDAARETAARYEEELVKTTGELGALHALMHLDRLVGCDEFNEASRVRYLENMDPDTAQAMQLILQARGHFCEPTFGFPRPAGMELVGAVELPVTDEMRAMLDAGDEEGFQRLVTETLVQMGTLPEGAHIIGVLAEDDDRG